MVPDETCGLANRRAGQRSVAAGGDGGGLDLDLTLRLPRPEDPTLDHGDAEAHDECAEHEPVGEGLAENQHAGGDADDGDQIGDQRGCGSSLGLQGAVVQQMSWPAESWMGESRCTNRRA